MGTLGCLLSTAFELLLLAVTCDLLGPVLALSVVNKEATSARCLRSPFLGPALAVTVTGLHIHPGVL